MLEMFPMHATYEGQPCHWCGAPTEKKAMRPDRLFLGLTELYHWYLKCARCSTVYFVEEGQRRRAA